MSAMALAVTAALGGAASAESLRICYEEWEPFSTAVDRKPSGLMVDIVNRALAAAGHSAVYSLQPYLRCIGNVRTGAYDAILMSSGEQGLARTTVSAAFWEVGVVARPDWPHDRYRSLQDFAGATVGLVDGYFYHAAVDAAKSAWDVRYASEARFNLRKASSGRIDLTITDIPWAQIQTAREELPLKLLSPILFATPQYLYFHPRRAAVAAALDDALRTMLADGTIDRLYERSVGTSFRAAKARAEAALIRD